MKLIALLINLVQQFKHLVCKYLVSLEYLFVSVSDGLASRPRYTSMWDLTRNVWKKQGVQGLYAGVLPNIIGNGLSWGFYFYL